MIPVRNHTLLRMLGFRPISGSARVEMHWRQWLRVIGLRMLRGNAS